MNSRRHTFFTIPRPVIGVSACLAGEKVRYDGAHRRNRWIAGALARHVDLVALCPEVAIGLGVPRAPIGLVGDPRAPRVIGVTDPARDVTAPLARHGRTVAAEHDEFCGYIFKSRSPSCGVWKVPVRRARSVAAAGRGGFAAALIGKHPLLPVEEDEGLADPVRRDNFIERVFAYRRWREFLSRRPTVARLAAFHAAHELQLLAHGRSGRRALRRLVAQAGVATPGASVRAYGIRFMKILAVPATRAGHVTALQRAAGSLKRRLRAEERVELRAAIAAYRRGAASWLVPVALLRRHARGLEAGAWMAGQTYLDPAPGELALRDFAGCR
jgi:uncharacterized protein YbbK (DUF523 family)/uncharacterized protein YbgA (DUF1722 family)